jgi:hypothetical protein
MAQPAPVTIATEALVGEVGALEQMKLGAGGAFVTVARRSKHDTVERCWVDANMTEPAIISIAAVLLEVHAWRNIVRRKVVGKRTETAFGTVALVQKGLADGQLLGVVIVTTSLARTQTYTCIRLTGGFERYSSIFCVPVNENTAQRRLGLVW